MHKAITMHTPNLSSQPHLRMFNCTQTTNEESVFSLFPLLPPEIRLEIWLHSLQRPRIIKVYFEHHIGEPAEVETPPRSRAIVQGYQALSKLLRVNRESRRAALSFYRVHIPCRLKEGSTEEGMMRLGTFYFNPEYDFLWINSGFSAKETLIGFLYHLKNTYDPRHAGLLKLAVDTNGLRANDLCFLRPSDLSNSLRAAFIETLTHIQEVFFVQTVAAGRHVLGYRSGIEAPETILNRSFPIMATTPTFERRLRDPRPIAGDLRKVYVGADPLEKLWIWRKILKTWDISPSQAKYKFMLAFLPPGFHSPIYNQESAKRWLKVEDDEWTGKWRLDDRIEDGHAYRSYEYFEGVRKYPIGALHEKYRDEDLDKATKPAFGFWLFPMDAFGKLPEKAVSEDVPFKRFAKGLLDLTEHWPELGLLSLPQRS